MSAAPAPVARAPPPSLPDWMAASARGIASLAFGQRAGNAAVAITQLRHLAVLPVDDLELDLSNPAQREFGDYELIERIGEGGMGVVYRARQKSLDREVAIKLLAAGPWASREFIDRFLREAQNAARMQHPNIVTIHEVGSADELHYFSMRLVRGQSLAAAIAQSGPFEPYRAARLLRTIAEAVDYAHSLGVLHLDLKPANVLLDEGGTPHVADFGLARRLEPGLAADNHEVSGTPSYMAPEQATAGVQKITPATDVWGLGAIGYELATGQPPFLSDSAQDTIELVVGGTLRPPRELAPTLPRDLAAIIEKCMARDAAQRYASARALADDLGRFSEHRAVHARRLNAMQLAGRWMRREPVLAATLGVFVLAITIGLFATTVEWRRAQGSARRAEAVREFLVDVFDLAAPDKDKGKLITARQLLEVGETQIARNPRMDPSLHADLAGLLGTLYWYIGDYAHAENLVQQASRLVAGGGVADVVQTRVLLQQAAIDYDQNRYAAAIASATHALTLARDSSRLDPSLDGAAQRAIANAEIGIGRVADAERRLRSTLAEDRARFGPASRAVADDDSMLGEALLERSRLDDAVPVLRDAIATATRVYGPESGETANAMDILGIVLRNQGEYVQAEAIMRKGADIAAKLYGPDSSDALTARSNMLIAVESQGRYAEALRDRLAMLPKQEKLASSHPEILAYAYKNIAGDYLHLGRLRDAESSARMALAAWQHIEGIDGEWHSVATRNSLALALQYQGRYSEAEDAFRKTVAIQRHHEPPGSVWLNQTLGYLGNLLRLEGRTEDAVAQLRLVVAALPDTPNPVRVQVLAELAEAELDAGDTTKALVAAKGALATARRALPAGNILYATADFALARVELASGDAGDAEPLLREALALRSVSLPTDDPRMLEVQVARVRALADLGRRPEADALRATVAAVLDRNAAARPYAKTLQQRLAQRESPMATR